VGTRARPRRREWITPDILVFDRGAPQPVDLHLGHLTTLLSPIRLGEVSRGCDAKGRSPPSPAALHSVPGGNYVFDESGDAEQNALWVRVQNGASPALQTRIRRKGADEQPVVVEVHAEVDHSLTNFPLPPPTAPT